MKSEYKSSEFYAKLHSRKLTRKHTKSIIFKNILSKVLIKSFQAFLKALVNHFYCQLARFNP